MADVYLLAPLGTEPSVVTEILWYLTVEQGHRVCGVEIWGTHSDDGAPKTSLRALRDRVERGLWRDLRRILEARGASERLPELPERFQEFRPRADAPLASPLRVTFFERGERPIPDVRNGQDAEAVVSQLHARVRHLCRVLNDIVLIGSIAGGRKNFGSALQGAFELQARPEDRILHVLLHEEIEGNEAALEAYVAPEGEVLGIPMEEQLTVVDVPFPPLRLLIPDQLWQAALEQENASVLWSRLRENLRGVRRARVERMPHRPHRPHRWQLVLEGSGEVLAELTGGQAETYLAVAALPNAGLAAWGQHIKENRIGREVHPIDWKGGDLPPIDAGNMRKRLSDLKLKLAKYRLQERGYGEFALVGDDVQWSILAGTRVRLSTDR